MKSLVIFDLDGTLLNTIDDLGTSCNHALERMGFTPHPLYTYQFMVGNGVQKLIQRAHPDATPEIIDALLIEFKLHYNEHNTDHTKPYNGIPELLSEINSRGISMAVASNKYSEAVNKIIPYFFPDIPFVAIMGQEEGRRVKPDPSIIFSILNAHPTPKSEVIYVGDSAVDIESARRACIESVGVTWGFRPVSELRQAGANHVVSTPAEILNFI